VLRATSRPSRLFWNVFPRLGAAIGARDRHAIGSLREGIDLVRQLALRLGLETVAYARLGNQKARIIGVGFDLLSQLANQNPQILDVLVLSSAPDVLEQMVVRHNEADVGRQNMDQAILFSRQPDLLLVERNRSGDQID
jgi:hypothetical protein